jgi:peptidyl-prolyl cis-trans isomerase A (cyclophilin A)
MRTQSSWLLVCVIYALAFFVFQAGAQNEKAPAAKPAAPPAAATAPAPKAETPAAPDVKKETTTPVPTPAPTTETSTAKKRFSRMHAIFETNLGKFKVRLFHTQAPKTVENFVGLAEGTKEWTDPKTQAQTKTRYFDGLIFHRIIDNFMIQGGDPLGVDTKRAGTGGPGFKIEDEFHPDLKHDKAGILSMANAGPNTGGSQFFITLGPTPHLNKKHAVFGEVIEGIDVVEKIGKVKTDRRTDRPLENVVIKKLTIERQ